MLVPISSLRTSVSPGRPKVRHTDLPLQCNFNREMITRLQIFLYVPTSILARPPSCTYPRPFNTNLLGSEALYTTQLPGWLPTPGCGIAIYPNWAIGITGLSPARVQPCRLLRPTLIFRTAPSPAHAGEVRVTTAPREFTR